MSETSTFDVNGHQGIKRDFDPKSYFPAMKISEATDLYLSRYLWRCGSISRFGVLSGLVRRCRFPGRSCWCNSSKIVGAIIGLFIGAVILMVISSICKGNTDFEANVRVIASIMVIMPISALLGFTMAINSVLGSVVALAVNLYALYMLYHGLTGALKAKPDTTKIIMYVLGALFLLFTIARMAARIK